MSNAKNFMCDMLYKPTDAIYAENIRQFQGCPTIAITKGGRIYMGWYSGGRCEPHIENYNILVYSDDNGKTWSAPLLIIPSCKERLVQALDIQLWISPEGKLYVFWVQNNVVVDDGITKGHAIIDGYIFEPAGICNFSLQEITKYYTDYPLYDGPFALIMNKAQWDSLPKEYQDAIEESFEALFQ